MLKVRRHCSLCDAQQEHLCRVLAESLRIAPLHMLDWCCLAIAVRAMHMGQHNQQATWVNTHMASAKISGQCTTGLCQGLMSMDMWIMPSLRCYSITGPDGRHLLSQRVLPLGLQISPGSCMMPVCAAMRRMKRSRSELLRACCSASAARRPWILTSCTHAHSGSGELVNDTSTACFWNDLLTERKCDVASTLVI